MDITRLQYKMYVICNEKKTIYGVDLLWREYANTKDTNAIPLFDLYKR